MHSRNENAEKDKTEFRNYVDQPGVERTYRRMYQNQNLFFVRVMKQHFVNGSGVEMSFKDAFDLLDSVYDESDPDVDDAQIYHAYQTGEALKSLLCADDPAKLRQDLAVRDLFSDEEWERLPAEQRDNYPCYIHELYPEITDWSWLPLIGFLHDVGKVLATEKLGEVPQWAVVGDTLPVGAPFSMSNVYADKGYHLENPDFATNIDDDNTFGVYQKHCGFNHVNMTWGHDEYGYTVLNNTVHRLPPAALYLIRFHSFYAWHTPRNEIRGYEELADDHDWKMLPLLKMFHESDLYSKGEKMPDVQALRKYYVDMLEQFVPGRVEARNSTSPVQHRW